MISYSVEPRGVATVTLSPTLRLRTARPTGEAEESLLGLGVVVLGVLGDVPKFPGLPDAVGYLLATYVGEVRELCLELLETFWGYEFPVLVAHKRRDYTSEVVGCQRARWGSVRSPVRRFAPFSTLRRKPSLGSARCAL